jgi:hypothetical protein
MDVPEAPPPPPPFPPSAPLPASPTWFARRAGGAVLVVVVGGPRLRVAGVVTRVDDVAPHGNVLAVRVGAALRGDETLLLSADEYGVPAGADVDGHVVVPDHDGDRADAVRAAVAGAVRDARVGAGEPSSSSSSSLSPPPAVRKGKGKGKADDGVPAPADAPAPATAPAPADAPARKRGRPAKTAPARKRARHADARSANAESDTEGDEPAPAKAPALADAPARKRRRPGPPLKSRHCALCNRDFSTPQKLRHHAAAKHGAKKRARPHVCRVCRAGFPDRWRLVRFVMDFFS